jgi:hypothetical protein
MAVLLSHPAVYERLLLVGVAASLVYLLAAPSLKKLMHGVR